MAISNTGDSFLNDYLQTTKEELAIPTSPDSGYEESFISRTMELTSYIWRNIGNPNPEFLGRVKENRRILDPKFRQFKKDQLSHQTVDAVLEKPFSKSPGYSIINALDLPHPLEHQSIEEKVKTLIVLSSYENSTRACDFLRYTCSKSNEIALAILNGENPLSDETVSLGQGGCGTVRRQIALNKPYAAKTLNAPDGTSPVESLRREHRVATLQHPNIIQIDFVDESKDTLYLELAEHGSLKSHLNANSTSPLSQQDFTRIVYEISSGLAYIHDQGFVHDDIKADNILLTENNIAKISDFGTTVTVEEFDPDITEGTAFYLPIDYLRGDSTPENCQKIDVWSFGLLLWQQLKDPKYLTPFTALDNPTGTFAHQFDFIATMCNPVTGFKGFEEGHLESLLNPAQCAQYDPSGALVALMKRCLAYNPDDRPPMSEIKKILSLLS